MLSFFHLRRQGPRIVLLLGAIAALVVSALPALAQGNDDPNESPLGDVARNFRKKPAQPVIDNDNLPDVMEDVDKLRLARSSFQYSIDPAGKTFHVSTPDATCSLAFTPDSRALLTSPYAQADLPPGELQKLAGPATINGDSLEVSVFNGTDWHVSEVAVAVTIIDRAEAKVASHRMAGKLVAAVATDKVPDAERPSNKQSDTTVLYKIRAAAAPYATTTFRASLGVEIRPDQEWHWAIVQARGYPPQRALQPGARGTVPIATPALPSWPAADTRVPDSSIPSRPSNAPNPTATREPNR